MAVQVDEPFAVALRAALVERVENTKRKPGKSRRRWMAGLITGALVAAAGTATATQLLSSSPPGADVVTHVASDVVMTGVGTQTVELGIAPAGANHVDVKLTCLTPGTFTFPGGAGLVCDEPWKGPAEASGYPFPLAAGQHTLSISADPGARWRLVATYSTLEKTAWGVNANGKTYGVQNDQGTPDLIAVVATNGKTGYVYATQLEPPDYKSRAEALAAQKKGHRARTLQVFEPDGRTVIGEFVLQ